MTVGAVPLPAPVQGVKQTKAILQTPTVQRRPWDARTGKPLGSESSASLAGRKPVKIPQGPGHRSWGFILCVMRACRHGDYSTNQVKTHLSDPSRARVLRCAEA